jgi:RND family efflux transporter MFP subunit
MEGTTESAEVFQLDSSLWRNMLSGKDEAAFFESWLALQARQLPGAQNATLVVADSDGTLKPRAFWPQGAAPGAAAMKAAQSAAKKKSGIVRRDEAAGIAAFAYPVILGDELLAVSAYTVNLQSDRQLQESLRRVQWGSVWLENRFAAQSRAALSENAERLLAALDLIAVSLEGGSYRSAALAFATEAAERLGAQRVSLGWRSGRKSKILAMSHVAKPDRRQALVRSIVGAMDEAMDQEAVIVHGAGGEGEAPQVTIRHRELAAASGSGGPIISVPLHDETGWLGAITAEYPPDKVVGNEDVGLVEAAGLAAARVLDLRRRDERWIVTKFADTVWTQAGRLLGPRYLGRKLAVLALAGLVAFFWVFTVDFRLPADARLEGEVQRVVSAPFDGYITDAFIRAGDVVSEDQLLATLDDSDLQLELAAWENRREQYGAERQSAIAERDIARARVYEAQIDEADVQIELARSKLAQSEIRAPFDGLVLSGDLSQSLGSGVRLGDALFQIAPLDRYKVRLQVDEEDIGYISEGQKGQLVLAARPQPPMPFVVTLITPVTVPEEGRNAFVVEAELQAPVDELRPGMEGAARIHAGEARLIWTWTRRAQNWMRMQLWRWMP